MLARLIGGLSVALALLAALPALAGAALTRDAQRVYDDYRSDGAVSPCRHTVGVYRTTLKEITAGIEEESPAFRPAVEAALEAREHEMCGEPAPAPSTGGGSGSTASPASSGSSSPGGAVPVPVGDSGAAPTSPPADGGSAPADGDPGAAAAPPTGGTPAQPAPVPAAPPAAAAEQVLVNRPYRGTPTGLVIAAALLGLVLLAVLGAAAARRFGWGDERLAGARHAWGESAYRAGGAWGDFLDWVRLGR